MYIFISHSSKNSSVAEEVCTLLESNSHQCFLSPRDIRSGHEYAEEIVSGIDRSEVMLLLLSEEANSSPHVLREVERAVSKNIPIIVYKLEEVVELSKSMEYFLMTHQWVTAKTKVDHSEILRCINEMADKSPSTQAEALSANASPDTGAPSIKKRRLAVVGVFLATAVLVAAIIGISHLAGGNKDDETGEASVAAESSEAQQSAEPSAVMIEAELGDRLIFGTYNEQPIEWRVIALEDGKATVISDRILTMKCYDAAEGGKYNSYNGEDYWTTSSKELDAELDRLIRGDNSWESSNIRTWLNSDRENITYAGQSPSSEAMSEKVNGYNTEAGFLNDFTDEEMAAIVPAEITTNGTVTKDMVWLLSSEELALLENADVSRYSVPTEQAVALDTSRWYTLHMSDYGVDDHYWWLRDGDGETASGVFVVTFSYAGGVTVSQPAGLEGYGIRPVMTLDLTSGCIKTKE